MQGVIMADSKSDTGVILAIAERFRKQRLPRALKIKEKVDKGGLLGDEDLYFLHLVLEDTRYIQTIADKHPEWQPVVSRTMSFYKEILDKALENEKANP
jgi:hypothetical protein